MIGRAIGNYVVKTQIGLGGQGAVYLAEHPRIERRVAIKVLHTDLRRDADAASRLFAEARSASAIRNQHIVDVLDFGELEDGTAYLIMEWLEGRTLAETIAAEAPLAPERAIHIALGAAEALFAAHARGIVHRDLKPSNLFLVRRSDDADFVKILDFGVAKFVRDDFVVRPETHSRAIIGTPTYMAPEQLRGARTEVGPRSDQYALGVILYEMLTGRLPFDSSTLGDLLLEKMTRPIEPLRTHRPTLPVELERVVLRLLARDAKMRFADVGELVDVLFALSGGDARTQPRSARLALEHAATDATPPPSSPAPRPEITTLGGTATESLVVSTTGRKPGGRMVAALLTMAALAVAIVALTSPWQPSPSPPMPAAGASPATAPPTAPPSEPPVRASEPAPVARITLRTTPADAEVTLDGARIANPFSGSFPRDQAAHRLEVRARGHREEKRWLVFDRDDELEVRLTPMAPRRRSAPATEGNESGQAAPSRGRLITDLPVSE